MYAAWIGIDETLPLIELKKEFLTKGEARRAAIETLQCARIKVVSMSEKRSPAKALVFVKTRR